MPNHVDEAIIDDSTILWRRILPDWIHHEPDGTTRPKSIAFVDRVTGELSVHIAHLTTTDAALADHTEDSLAAFQAGLVLGMGFDVVSAPTVDDGSHALIRPSPKGKKAKRIAWESEWVLPH